MSARALMILGTASHVGKSLLTAALGRIFSNDGYRVAPFKAQNMSLNSAATPDGREIGRAQALQAEACRVVACAEMNPILLKPSTDSSSQVVVLGRVWGHCGASDYHQRRVEDLFPVVLESYRKLAAEHDVMVLEGAGSPAEINLKAHDIVNLRMASAAGAVCLLVGDIDRGGVFASLLGTLEWLDPEERALIRGFVINKFRGDVELLRPGIAMAEERLKIPCLGVIPYLRDIGLEEEDSVALEDRRTVARSWRTEDVSPARPLRVGVIAFPYMSNFTDFDSLAAEPSVELAFLERAEDVERADVLVLPGSKQTLDDLAWLRKSGFANQVMEFRGPILGVCGGMQMLGCEIRDPQGIESRSQVAQGLGLLSIDTILAAVKTTRVVTGRAFDCEFRGYEIHLGETVYRDGAQSFAEIVRDGDRRADGAVNGNVAGTYVHGLLDDDHFRHPFLAEWRKRCGLAPATQLACVQADRDKRIERLADHVRQSLDMDQIRKLLDSPRPKLDNLQ
jgi:adenosylcobyric acid synthase